MDTSFVNLRREFAIFFKRSTGCFKGLYRTAASRLSALIAMAEALGIVRVAGPYAPWTYDKIGWLLCLFAGGDKHGSDLKNRKFVHLST